MIKTNRSKWNFESCKLEALKYPSKSAFALGSAGAFKKALRENWLDLICLHMNSNRKPNGYWTFEKCRDEASLYSSRVRFLEGSGSAYNSAQRNGWIDQICSHMISPQLKAGTWAIKENCAEEAKKYNSRSEFAKNAVAAYRTASEKGWLDEICLHMLERIPGPTKWTIENCRLIARRYDSRSSFQIGDCNAYSAALRWGWMDEICSHMEILGNKEKKKIYQLIFKDGSIYVGYSVNVEERIQSHLNGSSNKYVQEKINNNQIICIEYGDLWLNADDADELEIEMILKLREEIGSKLLNILDGGQRGSDKKYWIKEKCAEEALKYSTRTEFARESLGAYGSSAKGGWLDEICEHMIELKKPKNYWNFDRCQEEAFKYQTRGDFQKNSLAAYSSASDHEWMEFICAHMIEIKKSKGTWENIEACREEALKYNTRTSFIKGSRGAYKSALLYNWLDQICTHMTSPQVKEGTWMIKENCANEARKYKLRSEFQKKSGGAYKSAKKHNWLVDICSHMIEGKKPNGYWNYDRCKEEALKYKTRTEFQIGCGSAHGLARTSGWLDEICSHMKNSYHKAA